MAPKTFKEQKAIKKAEKLLCNSWNPALWDSFPGRKPGPSNSLELRAGSERWLGCKFSWALPALGLAPGLLGPWLTHVGDGCS